MGDGDGDGNGDGGIGAGIGGLGGLGGGEPGPGPGGSASDPGDVGSETGPSIGTAALAAQADAEAAMAALAAQYGEVGPTAAQVSEAQQGFFGQSAPFGIAAPANIGIQGVNLAGPPTAAEPTAAQDEAEMAAANAKAIALGLMNPDGTPGPNAETFSEPANTAIPGKGEAQAVNGHLGFPSTPGPSMATPAQAQANLATALGQQQATAVTNAISAPTGYGYGVQGGFGFPAPAAEAAPSMGYGYGVQGGFGFAAPNAVAPSAENEGIAVAPSTPGALATAAPAAVSTAAPSLSAMSEQNAPMTADDLSAIAQAMITSPNIGPVGYSIPPSLTSATVAAALGLDAPGSVANPNAIATEAVPASQAVVGPQIGYAPTVPSNLVAPTIPAEMQNFPFPDAKSVPTVNIPTTSQPTSIEMDQPTPPPQVPISQPQNLTFSPPVVAPQVPISQPQNLNYPQVPISQPQTPMTAQETIDAAKQAMNQQIAKEATVAPPVVAPQPAPVVAPQPAPPPPPPPPTVVAPQPAPVVAPQPTVTTPATVPQAQEQAKETLGSNLTGFVAGTGIAITAGGGLIDFIHPQNNAILNAYPWLAGNYPPAPGGTDRPLVLTDPKTGQPILDGNGNMIPAPYLGPPGGQRGVPGPAINTLA